MRPARGRDHQTRGRRQRVAQASPVRGRASRGPRGSRGRVPVSVPVPVPGSLVPAPGSLVPAPGSLVPGSRFSVPGSRFSVPRPRRSRRRLRARLLIALRLHRRDGRMQRHAGPRRSVSTPGSNPRASASPPRAHASSRIASWRVNAARRSKSAAVNPGVREVRLVNPGDFGRETSPVMDGIAGARRASEISSTNPSRRPPNASAKTLSSSSGGGVGGGVWNLSGAGSVAAIVSNAPHDTNDLAAVSLVAAMRAAPSPQPRERHHRSSSRRPSRQSSPRLPRAFQRARRSRVGETRGGGGGVGIVPGERGDESRGDDA